MRTRLSKGSNKVSKASVEPSSLQTVKTPVEVDSVNSQKDEHTKDLSDHPQLRNPSNWRKLQRRKRRCGKLSTKSRKLRSGIVPLPIAEEKKTDPGLQNVEGTILVELEVCTLRRKTERWDLKPIISECGRILVPHGATDFTDQIKFLKDKLQATKDEQSPEKILIDAPVDADDTVELDPESCTAPETTVEEMEAAESVDGGNDLQNITASDVNPEQNISKQLDVVNSLLPLNPESNSSKNEHTDTLPSQAFQEKHSDNLSPEKSPTKCEFLLRKLKSVLLKGKRKVDLVTGDTTPNTLQDTEPCLKKSKEVDSETEVLKSNDTNTLSTDAAVKEVPKMLPVDPLFAFALGLTPKVIPEKVTKTEDRDTPQKMDPTKTQEQMISDNQSQIIHRPPSIFTRRGRIKTLKKHQSVSAECIKKKWWLHFQTPACIASEKLKYKDSTSDNSVRKTEKTVNSAYSSADALNLLADLALSANNDQVPPQPKPSFERKPETSLKKSDLKKELTSAEQESVLHALLRQPAPRATEPHESPAPSHLVCELVGLVSKEHAYSLPPSSSLLLGLPGTSPVSDSPGLLHHDQPMYGIKTLQPTVDQQDRSEHNRTPEYLRKRMVRKQKFRYSRTFVNKEGSIKVTRHWQENYDFNLDSKFTSDSKDKTIIRALHGPWDFSIQDTNEEVRLIVHMWIGLFYSRSTPRFFHVEPNFSYLSLEESDSLEMVPSPARSEHLATALASVRSVTDTSDPLISTAWDLSKKDEDKDSVVLDLSLRNSSACSESLTSSLQVNKKGTFDSSEQKEPSETLNSVKLPRQLYEHSGKMVNSKENLTDMINVKKNHEGEKTNAPRKTFCLQSTDIPSFEDDGKVIPLQKVTDSASIKPNAPLAALGIGQVLHGCNEEKTNKKEGTENSGPKERSLVKQDIMDSFKFVKHEKNIEAEDVVQTDEHEKNKSKKLAICERKEDPCQKGNADPSQNVARAADDSAKESDIFCNGNCLESEKLLSRQEHKAVSQEQHESFKGVLVCGPKYKGKLMKDEHLRKDRLDEKDDCISALKADKDLAHQPLPEKCNGPDLVNQNFITQSNHQAQMNEQPSLTNNTKDACHDLLDAKMLCSDALVQDYSVSEKVSHTPFGIKSVNTESATKDISKKAIYLRNEALKTAVFRLSTPQTKDNVEMKSQNKERSDFSTAQSDYEDQDNKSAEEMLKDEKEQFQHQPNSPHCELLKACEAQVTFTKETDLRTDETNEGLDKNCTGVEIPFTGIDSPGEDTVQIKDYNAADEQFQHQPHSPQCNVPKICEAQLAFTEKTDVIIDKTNEGLDKCCTGVEIPFVGIDDSGEDTVQAKDDNATHKKPFQHQSHSPQHEFPKIFEAQVTSTKETDLRTDETNEGLDKNCTGVEIPFTGIDGSGGDTVQVKDYSATDEQFQHQPHSPQCNVPKICEAQLAFTEKTDVIIDKTNEGLDKCCTGVEIPFVGIEGSGGDTVQVKDYSATDEEQFQHQPHLLQSEVPKIFEAEVTSTKEPDLRTDETNEGLDKSCTGVEIPLIGIKSSGEDTVQPHGSLPHDRGEEVVQSQEEIPFISDSSDTKSALPDEVHSTSQECSKQALPCKILLVDVNERYRPVDLGNESDDRCPTPTIDEKPYGCLPRSSPNSSTSAFSGTETAKNLNHKSPSTISAPVNGELPCEQKICHTSIFNTDSSPHQVFHPDLEVRTLRVLQSIDKFLSISNYTDKSCQIQTPKMKESVDQSPNPSSKCIPSSLSFKDEKIGNNKPAVVPASVSQDLHKESSEHLLVSPFKNKLEEVLGVKLHLKKTDSAPQNYFERVNIQENSVGQDSHSYSPPSTELLQVIKPSLETERPKSTSQSSHEPRPFSHRPVMAVKPSKNDESQADFFSIDVHTEKPLKSKPPKTPRLAYNVPKSMLSERRTKEKSRRHSERLDDDQEACQLSFKNTWLPDVDNSKSNSVEAKFGLLDLSYQCQRKNISKFNTIPSSSPSVQSSESAESSSKIVDGVQCFLINGSVEKDEQTVKKNIEMDLKDSSSASASFMSQRDDDSIDESLILGPQSSLVCTVYNNSRKRPYSFLEQVSQRCLQDDLTQASVEQECLVFSEQMKQVLKKSERWSIHQEDIHDNIRPSCSSPMTINFSNLDEQEDSLDQLGTSLIGQKIKVDLSNRNDPTDKTEEDMLHPEEQSQGKDNSVEHDWVSDVTAECARLYEAKMHHVCAFKNVSSRAKHFRKNYTKTEPSNHFDFCDQMKKEMDKTFRTNLNSVVKKSCRTKYRFYILATSDDVFFEQTKAQLEAEGHTAIQPSDFFLGEDSSSSSIIIIRNEDIAEHICKVPHLLELKKSPSVQFAGIDEPDDVVNLTHQELFTQGGFIMFSRSTLDALSLCKMKKVSEILLELSKMGKWKWMLHYRDSRRIKENARLSAEAKEKKHFVYWGQDAGLLEVLPYHECDQMSKDQPDYLACLIRLQVQKISSRYPVFITDAAMDSGFEKNGILTMTSNSFLTKPLSEMFTV